MCTSPPGTLDVRQAIERARKLGSELRHVGAGFLEQRPRGAALLVEQRRHQVHRLDVLVVAANGQRLGIRQRRLEFGRQLIHSHEYTFRNSSEWALRGGYRRQFNGSEAASDPRFRAR